MNPYHGVMSSTWLADLWCGRKDQLIPDRRLRELENAREMVFEAAIVRRRVDDATHAERLRRVGS